MDRNRFLAGILMFLIIAESSNASVVFNPRKLSGSTTNDNSTTTQVSPPPIPVSGGKKLNPSPAEPNKSAKLKPKDPELTNNSSNVEPRVSNNSNSNDTVLAGPPSEKQVSKGKNHNGKQKKKGDGKIDSQLVTNMSCEEFPKKCRDQKAMLACILDSMMGSKELVLLIHNEGESTLKVNLTIPTSVDYAFPAFEIPKHQTKKVNLSWPLGESTKIVLDAGNGHCVLLQRSSSPVGNLVHQLSFYSMQVTPIYGAYLLILVTLIFGGTWACCKLRNRKRQDGGVPYQELEMGMPESASAVNLDTAEGWDQDWDDDWDEDKAVKSPGSHRVGNISANGLTSRSSKRDGWENDWED